MATLNDFNKTNLVDDHIASDINDLISSSLRSKYKNIETLSADRLLLDVDTPIQRFDCGAADRIVKAPAADAISNHTYFIVNASAAARTLTLKNNAGTVTIATLLQGDSALFLPDGNGGYLPIPNAMITLSPAQITANQNDYNPTGLYAADVVRISSDAARDITGLATGAVGRTVIVHNIGSFAITLKDESASSTAANRFALNADAAIAADQSVMLIYDEISARWRMVGGAGGSSSTLKLTTGLADGEYSGLYRDGTAGATLAFGDLVYFSVTDSRWELADADAAATAGPVKLGICVLAAALDGDPTKILLYGNVRADAAFPVMTIGAPLYVGVTAGDVEVAAPSGTGDIVRIVGYGNTADELFFCPDNTFVELV